MPVSATAVARVVGIETTFKNLRGAAAVQLPQRVAVVGQGSTASSFSLDPVTLQTAFEVGTTYGFGSALHLAALELQPINGDGIGDIPMTFYPTGDGTTVAEGDITAVGTMTSDANYVVTVNGIASQVISLVTGDTVSIAALAIEVAINATVNIPLVASAAVGVCSYDAKWKGASGNDIIVSIAGPVAGIVFTVTAMSSGATNPDVTATLAKIVDVWETIGVNCLELTDSTALDDYSTFGEGRWSALVKKPMVFVTGSTESTVSTLAAIGNGRLADRTNAVVVAPGSTSLPLQIAARAVARIALLANNNPPFDYGGQTLSGLVTGADADQFNYVERDGLVKAGISTSTIVSGNVTMSDTVTFYHPVGEEPPAYRYVVDIVKLQNIIFNLDVIFLDDQWNGAPLIPDGQPTTNPSARTPKAAKAAANTMIDQLALGAILSDPETAKASTTASINATNPKRLDISITVQLSGNTNVISIDLNFGFFFGTPQVLA